MGDTQKGSLLMIAAMALFAIEDMFVKLAAAALPAGQIVLVLGACGAPVFMVLARVQGQRTWSKMALHPAVLARNFGEMLGTLGFVVALASLPLALVLAVMQALPLVVTMGAALFLGARVGWRRWGAILLGFGGVLLVIRPGAASFDPMALWLIPGVLGMGLRDLAARAVPPACGNAQLSAWGMLAVTLLGTLMVAHSGAAPISAASAAWLAGGAVFGTLGYLAVTTAARVGDVSIVAPFRYVRLVFAMAIGLVVFGEWPDAATLAGASIIVSTGLYTLLRQRALSKARAIG